MTIGRVNDISGWQLLSAPTLGSKQGAFKVATGNQLSLKINEWLANSPDGNDWIELYNPSTLPIRLERHDIEERPGYVDFWAML